MPNPQEVRLKNPSKKLKIKQKSKKQESPPLYIGAPQEKTLNIAVAPRMRCVSRNWKVAMNLSNFGMSRPK